MVLYNKLWSHSELEFRDVYLRMNQAKRGYPGFSDAYLINHTYDSTGFYFGAQGTTAGNFWRQIQAVSFSRSRSPRSNWYPSDSIRAPGHLHGAGWRDGLQAAGVHARGRDERRQRRGNRHRSLQSDEEAPPPRRTLQHVDNVPGPDRSRPRLIYSVTTMYQVIYYDFFARNKNTFDKITRPFV